MMLCHRWMCAVPAGLLMLSLMLAAPGHAQGGGKRICDASGYCSLSLQPSHYVGPIETNLQLKMAMSALSFKQEVIITMDDRPDYAAQFVGNFQQAGYGHVLFIAPEPLCRRLNATFQQLGCGWYSSPIDERLGVFGSQMHLKHWTGARIARMGYNVMIVDGDVIVLNDFYFFVKSPPWSDYHLIIHSEGGSLGINCGFVYLQNASPSGPAVWALADAIIRSLRMWFQPEGIKALGLGDRFLCWDQDCIHDTYYSAVAGRPYFQKCVHPSNKPTWEDSWRRLKRLVTGGIAGDEMFLSREVQATGATRRLVGSPSYNIRYAKMQLPHIYGPKATEFNLTGWPEELGGQIYGAQPISSAIRDLIHEHLVKDIDAPLWPDLEDPATAQAAAAAPIEMFAFANHWLVNNWRNSGSRGRWNLHLTDDTQAVIGHIWAGLPPGHLQKRTIIMCIEAYDFALSERLWGPGRGYTATHHHSETPPPVLAYAPGLFDHTTTHDEFGFAVHDLGKLGVVSEHLIGWPGAPLAAGWTHKSGVNDAGYGVNGKPHVIPWSYINVDLIMAYTPQNDTLAELSGVWSPELTFGCVTEHAKIHQNNERDRKRRKLKMTDNAEIYHVLSDEAEPSSRRLHQALAERRKAHKGVGLLPPELKHFISRLPPHAAQPGVHNTMQAPPDAKTGPDGVILVGPQHVAQEAQRMSDQPIVWLTQRLRVDGPLDDKHASRYKHLSRSCCAMQYEQWKNNNLTRHHPTSPPICAMQF